MSQQTNGKEKLKKYKYDAFISYRHTELDKYIAEKIHKYLEEFKLPNNVKNREKLKKTRIERVFRDKEELTITNNLEDPIIQALKESEYLIVICSPRTKESVWCLKEIEKFIEFHGRGRILTVLIEGEPNESFPEVLLYEEEIVKEDGMNIVHRKNVEPLAADIRGTSKRQMCALLKTELLRVIAPILGLEYDDLRQRHRERRHKRILTATISAATLGLTIGIAGVVSALIINNQKVKIQEQNKFIESQNEKLLSHQAENLAEKSLEYLGQDRRIDAIRMALSSVTTFEEMNMPYTSNGRYALTESLRVYDSGDVNKAQNQFVADSSIMNTALSPSRKYLLACDNNKDAYVWDVVTGELLTRIGDLDDVEKIDFVGDTMLTYYNNDGKIKVIDFCNDEVIVEDDSEYVYAVKGEQYGKYVAFLEDNKINVYDITTQKNIYRIECEKDKKFSTDIIWCEDKLICAEEHVEDSNEEQNITNIKVIDIKSGDIIETSGDFYTIDGVKIEGGNMFILSHRFEDKKGIGIIFAIEENSGQVIWTNEYEGVIIKKMEIMESESTPLIVAAGYGKLMVIDCNTGKEYYNESTLDGIADFIISSDGHIQMLNHEGKLIVFNMFNQETYSLDYYIECNVDKIDTLGICEGGYYVLPMSSNYIIKYEKPDNEDKEIYIADENMEENIEELGIIPEDCTEEAKKIGVSNPEMVANILYINETIAMVSYFDLTMDIYDVSNKKVINYIGDINSVPVKSFGIDDEGNTYVAGALCGYCFDMDYNLIAEIDGMKYVDVEERYIIVGEIESKLLKIPMYSLGELIDKAEKIFEN